MIAVMAIYTICFIKQGNKILLLNREKPRWMGSWNGIGGKIEEGETPTECVLREVYEETEIKLDNIKYKGTINRIESNSQDGEIHAFVAELSEDYFYETPRKLSEGILDWKLLSWILHPENTGVATNVPRFLPIMLEKDGLYKHLCMYENNLLIGYKSIFLK